MSNKTRYQIGPQADLEFIHANNGYGENVINNKTRLIRALELDIDSEKEEEEENEDDRKAGY